MAEEWYYAKQGKQLGPVSTDYLTQLASSGQLQPTDLIWKEGMASWAPARIAARHLFPEPAAAAVPLREDVYQVEEHEPAAQVPIYRSRRLEEDEPYEDRPRRRSRQRGGNQALVIIGIGVGVLVVIGVVILLVVMLQPGNPRTFTIQAGEMKPFHVTFKQGVKAEVWITSERNTDIDLFVFDERGQKITMDTRFDKDCYVTFVPPQTQTYKLEVVNINLGGRLPVGSNRCTLRWSPP